MSYVPDSLSFAPTDAQRTTILSEMRRSKDSIIGQALSAYEEMPGRAPLNGDERNALRATWRSAFDTVMKEFESMFETCGTYGEMNAYAGFGRDAELQGLRTQMRTDCFARVESDYRASQQPRKGKA